MKLSEIVKQYRETHHISLRRFAQMCGLAHTTISNIENERNSNGDPFIPLVDTLSGVANAMGMSLDELLRMMDDTDVYVSETDALRDMLKDNPDMRMLLSTTSKWDKEDFETLMNMVRTINRRYED